jgi:hypothetical protein
MANRALPYLSEEIRIVRFMFADRRTDAEIAAALNRLEANTERGSVRTAEGIGRFRSKLCLLRHRAPAEQIGTEDGELTDRAADLMFQDLMRRAINRGHESCREGVFKNTTPFVGRMIHPEPVHSCCTSSASLCADVGDDARNFTDGAFA